MLTSKKAANPADIASIHECIQYIATAISALLQTNDTAYLASTNSSGDTQLGVDVRADDLITKALLELPCVRGICSEEKDHAVYKQSSALVESSELDSSGLLVAFDPLDGSSLFDSNLSVGSIFGIYDGAFSAQHIIAAGYVVYGPRLEVVFAHDGITHSLFDGTKWIQKAPLKLDSHGKINAPGGTQKHWSSVHKALIEHFFSKGYRLRYSGGMVPDLHQILCKGGGIFSYPATTDAREGKLRKLFEVFPFALIYEKAGGCAINGTQRILDLPCKRLHESTPCFFGSMEEISLIQEWLHERA